MAIEYICTKHANSHPGFYHPQHPTYPLYTSTQLSKMDKPALQTYAQALLDKITPLYPDILTAPFPTTKKDWIPYIKHLQTQIYLQPLVLQTPQPKANHANMVMLCQSLYQQLLQLETRVPDIQQVVIENQIGNIAVRMMVIQGMITMFYASRNRPVQIEHVSSSHKLKYAASLVPSLFVVDSTAANAPTHSVIESSSSSSAPSNNPIAPIAHKKTSAYKEHKAHAKEYCDAILETKAKTNLSFAVFWEEFRGSKQKKDDLADCFLQALWFKDILGVRK